MRDGRNPWLGDYNATRRVWSDPKLWSQSSLGGRAHRDVGSLLVGTGFGAAERIEVEATQEVAVGDLAQRVLTFSSSSPAVMGDRADAMLRDLEDKLGPFSHDGMVSDAFVATAQVVRRKN